MHTLQRLIQFFESKRGKKASENEKALKEVCEDVPLSATIYRWFKDKENTIEFREKTRGRPNVLRSAAMIDDVKWMVSVQKSDCSIVRTQNLFNSQTRSFVQLSEREICSIVRHAKVFNSQNA